MILRFYLNYDKNSELCEPLFSLFNIALFLPRKVHFESAATCKKPTNVLVVRKKLFLGKKKKGIVNDTPKCVINTLTSLVFSL